MEGGRPSRHHRGREPAPSRSEQGHRQRNQSGQAPTTTKTQTARRTTKTQTDDEDEYHQPLAGKTVLQFSPTTAMKARRCSVRNSNRSSTPVSRQRES